MIFTIRYTIELLSESMKAHNIFKQKGAANSNTN